jgi:hypothetical protein
MKNRFSLFASVLLGALVLAGLPFAVSSSHSAPFVQEKWTPFESLNDGNDVSVSYLLVNKRTSKESDWTWKFRNDGSQKITGMEFDYIEDHGAFGANSKTVHDVFPGSLEAGKVFGGWAAFLAESYTAPKIRITDIKRGGANGTGSSRVDCTNACIDKSNACLESCGDDYKCQHSCSDAGDECQRKCKNN